MSTDAVDGTCFIQAYFLCAVCHVDFSVLPALLKSTPKFSTKHGQISGGNIKFVRVEFGQSTPSLPGNNNHVLMTVAV